MHFHRHVCSHTSLPRPRATGTRGLSTQPRDRIASTSYYTEISQPPLTSASPSFVSRGHVHTGRRRCATHIGRRPTRWPGSTGGTSSCHHSTRTCSHRFSRPWPARGLTCSLRRGARRNERRPASRPALRARAPPGPRPASTGDHPPIYT